MMYKHRHDLKGWVGFLFLGVAVFAFLWWGSAWAVSPVEQAAGLSETDRSIPDMASSYYGALSRPLFPEISLGLPLQAQMILSGVLAGLMLLIALFAPKARLLIMLLTMFTIARHLLWRGFDTMDFSSPLIAVVGSVLYAAEIASFFSLLLGYFQIFKLTDRKPQTWPKDRPLPSVDVMVCTYNEPLHVMYRTLVGCNSIDYPNKQVYLCDDGNRPEMAQLAQHLGVNYLGRRENTHAKAGNLNNALNHSQGEWVLVFDADHVPCKEFLQEIVGFLKDPKLGFLQTPQHFFTLDPFQRNLLAPEVVNNEQELFFHVIEPGNDYWGAAFFGGSGAIFRRAALADVGGFAVETITEDVHTGLRLHAKGWKSYYYNRNLAAGLSQDSFADFVKQRLRWARGMTQILFYDNPLFKWGLTLPQRLCYFSGIWYFQHGLPRLIFLITPLFFLLFGVKTINAGYVEVLIYYLPSFICLFLGYSLLTNKIRHSFFSEVYETALSIYLLPTTLATILSPGRAKFRVTPKGGLSDRVNFNWRVVFPQIIIAALTIIGIGMAIVRTTYTPEYIGGIYTNLFWSLYNVVLLIGAIYVAQERPQYRLAPRVAKRVRSELRLLDGSIAVGYTTDVSESGVALVFDEPIPVAGTMSLKLLDWDINESTVLSVQAIRSAVDRDNRHYIGFRVVNRTDEQHQQLIRHMFGSAKVWERDYRTSQTPSAFLSLLLTPFRVAGVVEQSLRRRAPRFSAALACNLEVDGRMLQGVTREVSETGLSMTVSRDGALKNGQTVQVHLQWAPGQVTALPAAIKRIQPAGLTEVLIGLNFVGLTREQRLEVINRIYQSRDSLVRTAPAVARMLPCELQRDHQPLAQGFTLQMSEMGCQIALQDPVEFVQGENLVLALRWEPTLPPEAYAVTVRAADVVPRRGPQDPYVIVVSFTGLDMATLEALSQRLHAPVDVQPLQRV